MKMGRGRIDGVMIDNAGHKLIERPAGLALNLSGSVISDTMISFSGEAVFLHRACIMNTPPCAETLL